MYHKNAQGAYRETLASEKERLSKIMEFADGLDSVRFSPDGKNPANGFNIEEREGWIWKANERLAYEVYHKLLRVLDIEKRRRIIEPFTMHYRDLEEQLAAEAEIEVQIAKCRKSAKATLAAVTEQAIEVTDLRQIIGGIANMDEIGNLEKLPPKDPLEALLETAKRLGSMKELEKVKQEANLRKNKILQDYAEQKEKAGISGQTEEQYLAKAQEDYESLIRSENEILGRDFEKRPGAKDSKRMYEILNELRESSIFDKILDMDFRIKNDENQFKSPTHGATHTRRVSFFVHLLSYLKGLSEEMIKILAETAIDHDIGRTHEWEDPDHGAASVQKIRNIKDGRLDGYTETERMIIEAIITEHSISGTENKVFIEALNIMDNAKLTPFSANQIQTMLKGFTAEDIERMLNLFKDADKLDRVRLLPIGYYDLREGLNPQRLTYDESKGLESFAYECYADNGTRLLNVLDLEYRRRELKRFIDASDKKDKIEKICTEIDEEIRRREKIEKEDKKAEEAPEFK